MGREINSGGSGTSGGPRISSPGPVDGYKDRLLKYVPAEVVVVWGMVSPLIERLAPAVSVTVMWIVFGFLLVATPLYLRRVLGVRLPVQLAVSTVAFAVWAFYLGPPFSLSFKSWYDPLIGAITLTLFTFSVPIIDPGMAPKPRGDA